MIGFLYVFGTPLAGLAVLIVFAAKLFKRAKQTRLPAHITTAVTVSIAGLASAGFIGFMWSRIFRTGSWAAFALFAVPVWGLGVLLGMLPIAWAITTLLMLFLAKRDDRSQALWGYRWVAMASSLLIIVVYVCFGLYHWRVQWQKNLVYDESASEKDITAVYGHGAWRTSRSNMTALAQRANCPPDLLAELATHDDPSIRHEVAKNPNTPIHSLEVLANDPEPFVRMGVLTNRSSTPTILRTVAGTKFAPFPTILFVNNPETPEDVLAKLVPEDILASDSIYRPLAAHPHLPRRLAALLLTVNDEVTRRNLAANPSCPVEILVPLSSDQDQNVVAAVVDNPSTPSNIAEMARRKVDAMSRIPSR